MTTNASVMDRAKSRVGCSNAVRADAGDPRVVSDEVGTTSVGRRDECDEPAARSLLSLWTTDRNGSSRYGANFSNESSYTVESYALGRPAASEMKMARNFASSMVGSGDGSKKSSTDASRSRSDVRNAVWVRARNVPTDVVGNRSRAINDEPAANTVGYSRSSTT